MMLALWIELTRLRPLSLAYLNAYSATLVLAFRVMTCGSYEVSVCFTAAVIILYLC